MTILGSDTLADTNGTFLEAHNTGVVWTRHTTRPTQFIFDTNRIRSNAATIERAVYYAGINPSNPDYDVSANITFVTDNNISEIGVAGRMDTVIESHYFATYALSTNILRLGLKSNGASFDIATIVMAPASGTIKLSMIGDALNVYWNGVLMIQGDDPTLTGIGKPGVCAYNSCPTLQGVQLSNFVVEGSLPVTRRYSSFNPEMVRTS